MTNENNEKQGVFYGVWIVGGCFILLFLFAGAGFYSFSIFIKPLEAYFGWSRAAISLTMSIYMIVSGLSGPFEPFWGGIFRHYSIPLWRTRAAAVPQYLQSFDRAAGSLHG